MALDRQSIEKKDFPIGRRGYEPDAVDAHLQALADDVESLRQSARRRSETLASAASEQVRAIVEAAESSAAEIQRQAEEEASDIRDEATREARRARDQATDQAREYVGKVAESATVMLERVDAMERELSALVENLRTGANRLTADLTLLEGNMSELHDASGVRRVRFDPEPAPRLRSVDRYEPLEELEELPPVADDAPGFGEDDLDLEPLPAATSTGSAPAPGGGGLDTGSAAAGDTEGARLIALNMALNGTPRDETDRYLAENFELPDRTRLLDEVYASVE